MYKGYADALDLMLHFVTLPILGQYADKWQTYHDTGWDIWRLPSECGLFAGVSAKLCPSYFPRRGTQGVTGGFFSTVHAVIADKSNDEAQRGVRTGVITLFTHALLF